MAREIRMRLGTEILEARLNAGLSQRQAASAVGMSKSEFGRIERIEVAQPSVEQLSRACAAVGLKLVVRAYPDSDPVRDAAQIALLERFRATRPVGARWGSEVPLPIVGDQRAWDATVTFGADRVAVEAESRLRDVQALQRKIALKQRDGQIDRVILLVNDTTANRRALAAARNALRERFPLSGREILGAVRGGRAPTSSGILLL